MIRMHVALSHVLEVLLIVALAVLGGILRLRGLLRLRAEVFHLVLVGSLELGLDVECDGGELAEWQCQARLNHLVEEGCTACSCFR